MGRPAIVGSNLSPELGLHFLCPFFAYFFRAQLFLSVFPRPGNSLFGACASRLFLMVELSRWRWALFTTPERRVQVLVIRVSTRVGARAALLGRGAAAPSERSLVRNWIECNTLGVV